MSAALIVILYNNHTGSISILQLLKRPKLQGAEWAERSLDLSRIKSLQSENEVLQGMKGDAAPGKAEALQCLVEELQATLKSSEQAGAWFLADAEAAAEDRAQKSRKKGGLAVELLRLQCSRCFRITPTLPPLCLQGFDTASRIHGLAVATGCQPNAIVDGVVAACRLNEYVVAS